MAQSFLMRCGRALNTNRVGAVQRLHTNTVPSMSIAANRHSRRSMQVATLTLFMSGGLRLAHGAATMATSATGAPGAGREHTDGSSEMMVVYVTVPNPEVGHQLAACVNILPGVTSVYTWEGKVNEDQELLLIIKTRKSLLDQLTNHVKANHPYDVPEVIGLPILGGSPAYMKWLAENTKS